LNFVQGGQTIDFGVEKVHKKKGSFTIGEIGVRPRTWGKEGERKSRGVLEKRKAKQARNVVVEPSEREEKN